MSTAATLIPAYAAITLLMGGFNGLSIQLTLVGILAIIIHAAITPTDLSGPYPNFDNYHPTQPPFRDYVLVFGLASLALAALFSRIYPFLRSLDTEADLDPHPIPRTPSPSHTFTGQWTATASTLTVGSPDSPETIALNLRVSQLEAVLKEMRYRIDALTRGERGTDEASGVAVTSVTKPFPTCTPAPPLNATFPPPIQPLSPSPTGPNPTPPSALEPVDAAINVRERLRSLMESFMEETHQTDRLIHKMRDILARADAANDTTFEVSRAEDHDPPVPPSSLATPFIPSPYPSPSPSPSPDRPLRTPTIRRARDTPPLPPAVNQMSETAKGSSRTPKFNLALDLLDLSQAPCSTPLRSAKEAEKSVSPSHSSFVRVLEAEFGPQDLFSAPAFKRAKEADTRVHPTTRATSALTEVMPQDSTEGYKRDFISRVHERSLKALSLLPSRTRVDSLLDTRRNAKGKGNAVRPLAGMSDWLAEYRRRKKMPPESHPFHRDR